MEGFDYDEICDGIVGFVKLLHDEGLETTDSGDGSLFGDGMECAFEEPMVAISIDSTRLIWYTRKVNDLINRYGLEATVEGSFNPADGSGSDAVILVYGPGLLNFTSR